MVTRIVLLAIAAFIGGHAFIHLWETLAGHAHGAPSFVDTVGVSAPAILLFVILFAALRRPLQQGD